MPVRILITEGVGAGCKEAVNLIRGINGKVLSADRGYDTKEVVDDAGQHPFEVVIPPRRNCREQRKYDKYLYKLRYLIENAFLDLKRWCGFAPGYTKNASSFPAAVY